MDRSTAIARLKAREPLLRSMGIASLSLFGSTAREEAGPTSDIDLAARFENDAKVGMFRFAEIAQMLTDLLETPVDLVGEPARDARMQQQIDRDRVRVF